VSEGYLERALPDGHGRNVVNVILVDFRGLDTMGEIAVLAVAALGIVSLVRAALQAAARGEDAAPSDPGEPGAGTGLDVAAGEEVAP
jgi:multicomponent Na+:H+ antiporter subunit A